MGSFIVKSFQRHYTRLGSCPLAKRMGTDGFGITVDGEELRIEAEKKAEEAKEGTYYLRERHFGKFSRTLTLPFPVDAGKASATLENRVLQIRLPKAEEAKSKRIDVK